MSLRFAFTLLLLVSQCPLPAQLTRLSFGAVPTNLRADLSQLFLAPAATPGEFYLLAPFGGAPARRFPFTMFWWSSHPWMQNAFPNGWYEVQFSFLEWAYLTSSSCGLLPAPGALVPHGGIDSLYDWGPPLYTGPVLGVHQPLPGWVLGDTAVPRVSGLPFQTPIEETFALFLEDYWGTSLNACTAGSPVDWVAVRVAITLIAR